MFEETGSCYANFKEGQINENLFRTENARMTSYGNPETSMNSANFNPSSKFISSDKSSDSYTFRVK